MTVDPGSRWNANTVGAPAYGYSSITPSNSTDEADGPFRAIYVGGSGNLVVVDLNGIAATFVGVVAGSILPLIGKRVNSTNTTATFLIGLR